MRVSWLWRRFELVVCVDCELRLAAIRARVVAGVVESCGRLRARWQKEQVAGAECELFERRRLQIEYIFSSIALINIKNELAINQ